MDGSVVEEEVSLCQRMNLSREVVKDARGQLQEGVDWHRVGTLVKWSPDGVARLLDMLQVKKKAGPEPKKTPAVQVELTVDKIYPNPRLIGALTPDGDLVRVRVRDSHKFTRHMKIPCREIGEGLYELTRKQPRFPGRW